MSKKRGLKKAFFLEGADSRSGEIKLGFLAIDGNGLFLHVRLEHLAGLALRKADVVSVHLAFACYFTYCHLLIIAQSVSKVKRELGVRW